MNIKVIYKIDGATKTIPLDEAVNFLFSPTMVGGRAKVRKQLTNGEILETNRATYVMEDNMAKKKNDKIVWMIRLEIDNEHIETHVANSMKAAENFVQELLEEYDLAGEQVEIDKSEDFRYYESSNLSVTIEPATLIK